MKIRLIITALFLILMVVLNAIPSATVRQTPEQNAQAMVAECTVRHWGWPMPLYSHFGGGGYISPLNLLPSEATPIFSEWQILGLIIDLLVVLIGLFVILRARLPGLPGEGQENIPIVRDSDREDDRI